MNQMDFRAPPLVLVVDDDTQTRLLAHAALEQANFEIAEAGDGFEALAAFKQLRPDIVLLDLLMPQMDGFEACTELRRLPGGDSVPVLVITGLHDLAAIDRAYEVGATDFIHKPINWTILSHRVRYMVRHEHQRKQAEAEIIRQREELRGLAARLAEVEEMERKGLAGELHDDVCQNLSSIAMVLETLKLSVQKEPLERVLSRLSDAVKLVEQTGEISRNIMEGLRPTVLDHYGLMGGLRYLGEQFNKKTNISIEVVGQEATPRLAPETELALFRIAQEALANVAKHAQATRVIISKEEKADKTCLVITDNGIGFDQSQIGQPVVGKKWGLMTMSERARAIGGTSRIESQPGQGTRVIVEVVR
jgi:signal transduction histidine kinase